MMPVMLELEEVSRLVAQAVQMGYMQAVQVYDPPQDLLRKAEFLEEPIVKRVIATEGQTVDIDFDTGEVSVDSKVLDEPYISTPTQRDEGVSFPVTVPEGMAFVMGDNRMNSTDSRSEKIGMIDTRYILGKAVFRIYPFDRIGFIS